MSISLAVFSQSVVEQALYRFKGHVINLNPSPSKTPLAPFSPPPDPAPLAPGTASDGHRSAPDRVSPRRAARGIAWSRGSGGDPGGGGIHGQDPGPVVVGHPDREAAAAVFAIDPASGDLLAEQQEAQDVRVRALAAPVGSALAAPALAGVRRLPFIGQFWPLTSLTPGGRNRVQSQYRPHGEFCLQGSCGVLHGSTSIGIEPG